MRYINVISHDKINSHYFMRVFRLIIHCARFNNSHNDVTARLSFKNNCARTVSNFSVQITVYFVKIKNHLFSLLLIVTCLDFVHSILRRY